MAKLIRWCPMLVAKTLPDVFPTPSCMGIEGMGHDYATRRRSDNDDELGLLPFLNAHTPL
jgi:hypothetical protein